ncbi:hypothetical protein ROHU_029771 [Labeo rohita]|uniref:Uncharacterized protein n=1 Tax=Labeo rohita TaxID=84645 RepID=A0A498LWI6_LABRO|nr:hypothetical protein ROHU_029771 [Labeo rohita]
MKVPLKEWMDQAQLRGRNPQRNQGVLNPGGDSRLRDLSTNGEIIGHEGVRSHSGANGSKGLGGVLGLEGCSGAEGSTLGGPFFGRW